MIKIDSKELNKIFEKLKLSNDIIIISKGKDTNVIHIVKDEDCYNVTSDTYTIGDFISEYFSRCSEDNGIDNELLDELYIEYYIDKDKAKNIINENKHYFI